MNKYLRIAASQFPVSDEMNKNLYFIKNQITEASSKGADVIHFPETALPGYFTKSHKQSLDFNWHDLESLTRDICHLASNHNIWIILGTIRKIDSQLPRNCLCVISCTGEIIGYYDKQRLYESEKEYYSGGNSPFIVNIKGYKCGFLICYDNCFPELYNAYRDLEIGLIFHSFHNAGNTQETSIKDLMSANLLVRSADNQMWISASNSSKSYSPLPATIARPDGSANVGERHTTSIVIEDYPKAKLGWTYDNTKF